jgi:hypothetical protein
MRDPSTVVSAEEKIRIVIEGFRGDLMEARKFAGILAGRGLSGSELESPLPARIPAGRGLSGSELEG